VSETTASAGRDFYLRTGPFVTHLTTTNARVRESVALFYGAMTLATKPAFSDFHIAVAARGARRWWRPQATFYFDGAPLFLPAPAAHGALLFEWGLNWVIASCAHQYLGIHSAALERDGRALIIPGPPGSGKSTLGAALAHRGWRLLSDELALIEPETGALIGLDRPISLKNDSIDLIRRFAPEAVMSAPVPGTSKGTIALAKAPAPRGAGTPAAVRAAWIVFLNFEPKARPSLAPRPKAECFIELAANTVNYGVLGERGFDALGEIVDRSRCFEFTYGELADGVRILNELADGT
jgi:HprK-related kinase A